MTLDDRLQEILNEFGNSIKDQSSWMRLGGEFEPKTDPIAQIKAAFAESLDEDGVITEVYGKRVMAGQEFYDRFEKELGYVLHSDFTTELGEKIREHILVVAKKAAGL